MRSLLFLVVTACWQTPSAPTARVAAALGVPDLTWVHEFTGADGNSVRGALVEVDGRWYGLAGERGPNGTPDCNSGANWSTDEHRRRCPGSLFSVGPAGDLRVEHAFTQLDDTYRNYDGYHPYGTLVAGPGGWLYGATQMGGNPDVSGARGSGVLFRFNPVGGDFSVLHSFFVTARAFDGTYPMGTPAPLPDGRVCGTSKEAGELGSGAVWCWSESGFDYGPMPAAAGGSVGGVTYAHGKLHGVTSWGGLAGMGAYFTFDPDSLAVTIVDSWPAFPAPSCCNDNTSIQSPLLLSNGDLVIARQYAGANGSGVVARLDATGIHVLREFDLVANKQLPEVRFSNATGGMANGQLTEGCDGLIYGTTMYGGASGTGAVYQIARDGTQFRLLHSFDFASGYPYGGVTRGADCALWGTTFVTGRVFRFVPKDSCAQ